MTRYQTVTKAAESMNLSPWMLRTLVKRGEVPGFVHGNRFYIDTLLFAQKLEEKSRASVERER